jgi:hypothetical protein
LRFHVKKLDLNLHLRFYNFCYFLPDDDPLGSKHVVTISNKVACDGIISCLLITITQRDVKKSRIFFWTVDKRVSSWLRLAHFSQFGHVKRYMPRSSDLSKLLFFLYFGSFTIVILVLDDNFKIVSWNTCAINLVVFAIHVFVLYFITCKQSFYSQSVTWTCSFVLCNNCIVVLTVLNNYD